MRDNFTKITRDVLAKRVSFRCSNPNCKRITVGPHSAYDKVTNLGVAAHISGASKGGPRYNEHLTQEQRRSVNNGIWLCQTCAKLIDTDIQSHDVEKLIAWKMQAELVSLSVISGEYIEEHPISTLAEKRIKVCESFHYEIREVDSMVKEVLDADDLSTQEKKDVVSYLGLQIARFADDNGFHLQNEIIVQCIGTFVGVADIINLDGSRSQEGLEMYHKNLRASMKLLKSVRPDGQIDITTKTPLMTYYAHLVAQQGKGDYI